MPELKTHKTIAWLLLLPLSAALLYLPFISNPPFFDDLNYFDDAQSIVNETFQFAPRWLSRWSLGRTFEYFGTAPEAFRVGNLLLHLGVALVLYQFTHLLISRFTHLSHPTPLAAMAALLFVVHPVAVFATGYIVQRTIVLATLFSLLAWMSIVQGSLKHQPAWLYASACFYFLACLSKEHAVTSLAVMVLFVILLWRSRDLDIRDVHMRKHILVMFALYAVVAIMVVAGKLGMFFVPYEPNVSYLIQDMPIDKALAYPLSVISQTGYFFKYVLLWLVPNTAWMAVDMREPFAQSLEDGPFLVALLAFCLYIVAATVLLWRGGFVGLIGLLLLTPAMMFATELTTIRIQDPFVLYRSYLWMPLVYVVLMACLLGFLSTKLRYVLAIFMSVALFLFSHNQLITFSRPLFIWDQAATLTEGRTGLLGLDRIFHNRGLAYYQLSMADRAMRDYNHAIEIAPDIPYSYVNRGALLFDLRRYPEALSDFNTALTMSPSRHAFMGRGMVHEALGQLDFARSNFLTSCRRGLPQACVKLRKLDDRRSGQVTNR